MGRIKRLIAWIKQFFKMEERPRKAKRVMKCYNCHKPLTRATNKVEHIPAKCLYEGQEDRFKLNRYTVPACEECNGGYSRTDETFRNLIAVIVNKPGYDELVQAAIRSIQMNPEFRERIIYNPDGTIRGVVINVEETKAFHKKNFKGLYYKQYGEPLPLDYNIVVDIRENEPRASSVRIVDSLLGNFRFKHSGHPDIFSYILQPFRENQQPTETDIPIIENERFFACIQRYCLTHSALVVAEKQRAV